MKKRTILIALVVVLLLSGAVLLHHCLSGSSGDGTYTVTSINNGGYEVIKTYDENDVLLTTKRYDMEGYFVFEYDAHENVIKKSYYDLNGDLEAYTEYAYDQQDREISCIIFDKNGNQTNKTLTEYAQDGTKTIDLFNGTNELLGTTVFKYNENGDIIEQLEYMADGTLDTRQLREYNEDGNETATFTYNGDGSLSFRSEDIYDEDGNFLDHIEYDADGNVINLLGG